MKMIAEYSNDLESNSNQLRGSLPRYDLRGAKIYQRCFPKLEDAVIIAGTEQSMNVRCKFPPEEERFTATASSTLRHTTQST